MTRNNSKLTCSEVFKDIIKGLPLSNSVIYLRGIKHQEMESILQFMYLGEATFHQDKMNELLNVAKNLKIKVLSHSVESNDGSIHEQDIIDSAEMKEIEPKNEASDDSPGTGQLVSSNINETISTNKKLLRKISVERPLNNKRYVMFPCDQCDYQATRIDNLNQHIKSRAD